MNDTNATSFTNSTNVTNSTNFNNFTININGTEEGKLQLDQKVFLNNTNTTNASSETNLTASEPKFDYNATCGALDLNVLPDTEDIDEEEDGCFVYSCVVEEELKKRKAECEKNENKCEAPKSANATENSNNTLTFENFQNFTNNSVNFALNATNNSAVFNNNNYTFANNVSSNNSLSLNLSVLHKQFLVNSSTLPDSEIRNVSLSTDEENSSDLYSSVFF